MINHLLNVYIDPKKMHMKIELMNRNKIQNLK